MSNNAKVHIKSALVTWLEALGGRSQEYLIRIIKITMEKCEFQLLKSSS